MKKMITLCMVVIMLILSLTACTKDEKINNYITNEVNNTISAATSETNPDQTKQLDTEKELEIELNDDSSIIGYWVVDSVKFNNIIYQLEELEDLLNEEAFASLQLAFEFTKNEVTIYIGGENKATTGYRFYEEIKSVESENIKTKQENEEKLEVKYVDESGQLIFILVDGTLQIEQSQSTLILVKQPKEIEVEETSQIAETK